MPKLDLKNESFIGNKIRNSPITGFFEGFLSNPILMSKVDNVNKCINVNRNALSKIVNRF